MYEGMIASNINDFAVEFGYADWVCPKVDEMRVQKDPATFKAGTGVSFNMVINTCEEAK